jgi:murein L,D-transpeptidase YafK
LAVTSSALASVEPYRVAPVDRLIVEKTQRRLTMLRGDAELISFRVALGHTYGPKIRQGDGRTPEGSYFVDAFNPRSDFYRSIHISYPNDEDWQRAVELGVRPGGQIMIHGLDPAIAARWHDNHWMFNWTNGCIAVTNPEMDLIWESVELGTPVEIRP